MSSWIRFYPAEALNKNFRRARTEIRRNGGRGRFPKSGRARRARITISVSRPADRDIVINGAFIFTSGNSQSTAFRASTADFDILRVPTGRNFDGLGTGYSAIRDILNQKSEIGRSTTCRTGRNNIIVRGSRANSVRYYYYILYLFA